MRTTIDGVDRTAQEYIIKIEWDSNNNPIYVGKAIIGSLTSSSLWQIKKLAYDSNFNVTDIQYASSTDFFDKIWNLRATYLYG